MPRTGALGGRIGVIADLAVVEENRVGDAESDCRCGELCPCDETDRSRNQAGIDEFLASVEGHLKVRSCARCHKDAVAINPRIGSVFVDGVHECAA
jgi:hypothetical protein